MSERMTNILGYLTLFVILAAIWVLFGEDPSKDQGARGELLYKALGEKINDASRITLSKPNNSTVLVKGEDGQWSVQSKEGYKANNKLVTQMLRGLVLSKRKEPKTFKQDRMFRLGLDENAWVLSVKDSKGVEFVSLQLGKHRTWQADATLTYVMKKGDTRAWEVTGLAATPAAASAWLSKSIHSVDEARVKDITLSDGTRFERAIDAQDYSLVGLKASEKYTKAWAATAVASTMSQMSLVDVQQMLNPLVKAKAKVSLATHNGLGLDFNIFDLDGKSWVQISASFDQSAAGGLQEAITNGQAEANALNQSFTGWLFELPSSDIETLLKRRVDFLEAKPASKEQ